MKTILNFTSLALCAIMMSCGGSEPKPKSDAPAPKSMVQEKLPPASERITLDDKGVGQIKDLPLDPQINQEMVAEGEAIFKTNCTACHKVEKRFIGPSPKGIMERRSPEWIMNMILDPQLMVEQDRCAMDLLVEFNGAAMANQNLTVDQARSILEYFRTL
jgi:mono/diheme cytochrome c family protein